MHLFINGILDPVFSIQYLSKGSYTALPDSSSYRVLFLTLPHPSLKRCDGDPISSGAGAFRTNKNTSFSETPFSITEVRHIPAKGASCRCFASAFALTINKEALSQRLTALGLAEQYACPIMEQLTVVLTQDQSSAFTFLLKKIFSCHQEGLASPQILKYSWLCEILQSLSEVSRTSSPAALLTGKGGDTIHRVISYIEANYTENLSVDTLSSIFYISKYHLMREFKKVTGCTIHAFLLNQRISQAQHMLDKGIQAGTASALVGFSDYSLFYRSFLKLTGSTPRDYNSACYSAMVAE